MNEIRRIYQGVHGAGWIVLGLGAAAIGGLLIYGAMPAEGQNTQDFAQAEQPLPTPGAQPEAAPPPGPPTEEEREARAAAVAAKINIDILGAWTKATSDVNAPAPVYLQIVSAEDPDRLVGVEVAAADDILLRETPGQRNPNAIPAIDIGPGETLDFRPDTRHFMLTGLKAPLKEGDSFLLTFKFDKAGTENAVVKILGSDATGLPVENARPGDTTQDVSATP